jgi:hypothetical protein
MEESESSAYERVETYTEVGAARGNRYHVPYFPISPESQASKVFEVSSCVFWGP